MQCPNFEPKFFSQRLGLLFKLEVVNTSAYVQGDRDELRQSEYSSFPLPDAERRIKIGISFFSINALARSFIGTCLNPPVGSI